MGTSQRYNTYKEEYGSGEEKLEEFFLSFLFYMATPYLSGNSNP